jgi:hypothetical protein
MFIRKSTEDSNILLHRVAKHGSHDQKTHGKGGGSGGSGGGSSTSLPERKTPFSEERINSEISGISDKARDLTNELANNPSNDRTRDLAQKKAFSVRESLDRASSAKTLEGKKESLKNARAKIPTIVEMLEDQNYNSEASNFAELSTNISTVITMMPRSK